MTQCQAKWLLQTKEQELTSQNYFTFLGFKKNVSLVFVLVVECQSVRLMFSQPYVQHFVLYFEQYICINAFDRCFYPKQLNALKLLYTFDHVINSFEIELKVW